MRLKRLLTSSLVTSVIAMMLVVSIFQAFSGDNTDYPGGSPAGYTGSPGDGKDCKQCHGGTTAAVANWITSNIPVEGYVPGSTYTITVTVTGSGKKGFQVSPQNGSGDLLGTLTAGNGTELNGGGKYVTQSSSVNTNPAIWTFGWTAPNAGTGEVTFYGAFTLNKPVTKTSFLTVQEYSQPFTVTASSAASYVCEGASTELLASVTGAPGAVTYAWSSEPAGFSSTLQNPTVTPSLPTIYTITATSEGQSVTDQVSVDVVTCTGIPDQRAAASLGIFPNPSRGNISISWPQNDHEATDLTIVKPDGSTVYEAQRITTTSHTIVSGELPTGLLLVKVKQGSLLLTGKIVVQ